MYLRHREMKPLNLIGLFSFVKGLGVLLFADTMERHRTKQPVDTDPLEVNANPMQLDTAATSPPQNIMAR